jgi:hypothetical protein
MRLKFMYVCIILVAVRYLKKRVWLGSCYFSFCLVIEQWTFINSAQNCFMTRFYDVHGSLGSVMKTNRLGVMLLRWWIILILTQVSTTVLKFVSQSFSPSIIKKDRKCSRSVGVFVPLLSLYFKAVNSFKKNAEDASIGNLPFHILHKTVHKFSLQLGERFKLIATSYCFLAWVEFLSYISKDLQSITNFPCFYACDDSSISSQRIWDQLLLFFGLTVYGTNTACLNFGN